MTDNTPERTAPCPLMAINPTVATAMAMASYSVTYTTFRLIPCMGETLCLFH